jgi:hypothetical protein
MFFIIGDIWTIITVKLIGGIFRLLWFLTKTLWWLGILLVTSVALMVRRRGQPDQIPDAGEFVGDGEDLHWRDLATGTLYPVDQNTISHCEVQASERAGMDMRMTAASRLLRGRAAVMTNRFAAIIDGTGQVAAATEFPQECYHNIGLDHVDPAQAALDQCDLRMNREQALAALDELDGILAARGWRPDGASGPHWYSRTYQRPVIRWDQPVEAVTAPAAPALAQ